MDICTREEDNEDFTCVCPQLTSWRRGGEEEKKEEAKVNHEEIHVSRFLLPFEEEAQTIFHLAGTFVFLLLPFARRLYLLLKKSFQYVV